MQQVVTFTPDAALNPGKHTVIYQLLDNAGNKGDAQTFDFWIDDFQVSMASAPIAFNYDGNLEDTTDGSQQQQITVSTYGAYYTFYARLANGISDGFGNSISDVDVILTEDPEHSMYHLNGTTFVELFAVTRAQPSLPSLVSSTYMFDVRAAIPSLLQAAGDYSGALEFIVVPEYL